MTVITERITRRMPLRERLLSRLIVDPSGCLLWTGSLDSHGYGQLRANGRTRMVHRVMWEMFVGPIPGDLPLDHVWANGCRNRNCASIAHLEPVTPAENNRRSGRTIDVINAAKTKCPQDHDYDADNTWIRPHDGARVCRICMSESGKRQYRKHHPAPEHNPYAVKLTAAIVAECRRRAASGELIRALAEEFQVNRRTISLAVSGTTWQEVGAPVFVREWQQSEDHCPHGHDWTPETSYIDAKGHRYCRRCNADSARRRRAERRGRTS